MQNYHPRYKTYFRLTYNPLIPYIWDDDPDTDQIFFFTKETELELYKYDLFKKMYPHYRQPTDTTWSWKINHMPAFKKNSVKFKERDYHHIDRKKKIRGFRRKRYNQLMKELYVQRYNEAHPEKAHD